MEYILTADSLCKHYRHFRALNDFSIHVPKGSIYGIVGKNGAGKTTLLRLICGLQDPSSGSYELYGVRATDSGINRCRRRMGAVIETPSIYMDMTAEANLKEQYRIIGLPDFDSIPGLLKLVGLENAGKKKARHFSLGMRQRLGIAVALAGDPDFLVLDEPINGLDPIGIAEMRDFIRELCSATGKTILISSHILSEISLLADDIGIIDHGVLLEEESLKELEAKNGKYFRFTVSNAALAANLLQSKLGIQNVQVDSANELTVRDLRLDTGAAVRLFVDAGVSVSDAHLYEDTLEDYFKQVTGGEGIA